MLDIPKVMKEKLEQDSGVHAFTLTSIDNLKPWLDTNTTVFFPEYTDHSVKHLNEVLATAQSIITDESWEVITPEDVSAMIISVLLHDCAMHITEDGFYSLIEDTYPTIKSQYVDVEPRWSEMWSDYVAEAKRFNSEKLESIFNDSNPINDIPDNKIDLTTRDKLLIGEFIRRHHARIAHEIVFNGVPGANGNTLNLANEPSRHFLDLCGFIAKSHNMSLRKAVDRIPRAKRRVHLHAHVPFLMSVLRISDYIQVQSTRAPSNLLKVKSLISPISRGEWKKHDAILEISHADEDPEALFIDAEPQDALIFEDLRWLFNDIQRELDEVWAVLGEVYGRYDEMSNLGINIRRLRSSLDDINTYIGAKKPNFIPKVLKFRTADSEMMELLIAPLYGNKPEIGIRELVQNAVDACLERDDIVKKQGLIFDNPKDYDVCVSVIEYEDYGEVIIEDYGIGMTLDIIENYFLNIGASFRNSDRWKKAHETDGDSDINRTGRFGIGILAAYLLGDELDIKTRHISQPQGKGLSFKCQRGSKSVTISNINCPIGTEISIKTKKNTIRKLITKQDSWDWFCLVKPIVKRSVTALSGKTIALTQNIEIPLMTSISSSDNWHEIKPEKYESVLWTLNDLRFHHRHSLICNGILIGIFKVADISNYNRDDKIVLPWKRDALLIPKPPTIAVFDNNGEFPLNIQRTELTSVQLGFEVPLAKSICSQVVIYFFNELLPSDFKTFSKLLKKINSLENMGWFNIYRWSSRGNLDYLIFSKKGVMLLAKEHLINEKPTTLQFIVFDYNILDNHNVLNKYFTNFSYVQAGMNKKHERLQWVRDFFELRDGHKVENRYGKIIYEYLSGSRLFIKKSNYAEISKPGMLPATFRKNLEVIWENEKWYLLENRIGSELPLIENVDELVEQLDKYRVTGVIYHYFDWTTEIKEVKYKEDEFSIAESWLELNNNKAYFKPEN